MCIARKFTADKLTGNRQIRDHIATLIRWRL